MDLDGKLQGFWKIFTIEAEFLMGLSQGFSISSVTD